MERKLTVVPMSGLGNRMRVAASVVEAAKDIEGQIRIVWQPAWDCRARFSDLFLPLEEETPPDAVLKPVISDVGETTSDIAKTTSDSFQTTSETSLPKAGFMRSITESASSVSAPLNNAPNNLQTTSDSFQTTSESFQKDTDLFHAISDGRVTIDAGDWRDRVATKINLWLPLLYRRLLYDHEERNFRPSEVQNIRSMARRYPSLYIASCYELASYSPRTLRRCFRPLPELRDHITGLSAQYSPHTLGVHVRRTDNVTAIRRSPLSAFRRRIDRLLDDGTVDTLFLCTDSVDVRRYFRQTYGRRVLTRQITVRRDTLQGMRDAVIDLWCLALTSHILGSCYSSFSEIASELTGVPFEVASADETSSN